MNTEIKKNNLSKAIIISIALILSLPLNAMAFSDVPTTHPYKDAIDYLEKAELTQGFEDGTFRPDEKVNQAEMLTFALNATGNSDKFEEQSETRFLDVPKDAWFYNAVETAIQMGIVEQKENQTYFEPGKGVSKVQALEILFNLYNVDLQKVSENESVFADIDYKSRFAIIAKTARFFGIWEKDNTSVFRPLKTITRAELAYYIYKIETIDSNLIFNRSTTITVLDPNTHSITKIEQYKVLLSIWDAIHKRYFYQDQIDDAKLLQAAINGLVNELGDEHTIYEPPSRANDFVQNLNNDIVGIGVEINTIDNKTVIISVYPDTPASNSGLKAKDIITKVGTKSTEELSLQEVADLIRGEEGSKVNITVQRGTQTLTFSIVRAKLDIKEVSGEIIEGNIGYVQITSFSQTAGSEFINTVDLQKMKGAKAYIIDIRNNPGGFLNTSIQIAAKILPNMEIVTSIQKANGDSQNYFSGGPGTLSNTPLVILVNEGSASASEILAAAIKDHKAGTIIGTTTFGKGTVQDISYYSDGSFLKMTVAKWLTPKGKNIDKIGVYPDIYVNNIANDDTQLEKAIEIIKTELAK